MQSKPQSFYDKKYKLLNELIETEKKYLSKMRLFNQLVVSPFTLYVAKKVPNQLSIKHPLLGFFSRLRESLKEIFFLGENFLAHLERVFRDWQVYGDGERMIGPTLLKNLPFFKIYSSYFSVYNDILLLVCEIEDKKRYFRVKKALRKAASHPELCEEPLDSFLIRPVQRLPRYKLFISSLSEKTPTGHRDSRNLEEALESITSTINYMEVVGMKGENKVLCEELGRYFGTTVKKVGRFFFGKTKVRLRKFKNIETHLIKDKFFEKEFSCYMFNDYFLFAKGKKMIFKFNLENLKVFRKTSRGGWSENEADDFRENESEVKIATKKTNVLVVFNDPIALVEFFLCCKQCTRFLAQKKNLDETAEWANEMIEGFNEIKKLKIQDLRQESETSLHGTSFDSSSSYSSLWSLH